MAQRSALASALSMVIFSRSASSRIAWRTCGACRALHQIAPVRQVGPITAVFWLRKCTRSMRWTMRSVRSCLFWAMSSLSWIGAENCTRVLRPSTRMLSSLRRRPVTAQLSANSSFQALVSRFGDCPRTR